VTVACALEHPDGVWLGADSFVGDDDWRDLQDRPKFARKGAVWLACSGDGRACDLALAMPPWRARRRREEDLAYLAEAVVEPIRRVHKAADVAADAGSFSALLVYRGRVYVCCEGYSLSRSHHGYATIGAGGIVASGSLASTDALSPGARIRHALQAAARHCNHVAPPFHVIRIAP
jgi:hypothetical protein